MNGSVFSQTLRQSWRQAMYWGVGLGLMGLMVVMMIPDVEAMKAMTQFLESMPPFLLRAVGVGDDLSFIATPDGFVAIGFFGKTLLLLAAYPVIIGLRVSINEEENGTMDMLLSLPVPRWRLIIEKFAAYTVTIAFIGALLFAGVWIGQAVSGVQINLGRVAETIFNMLPSMTLILAFTVLIGTLVRRRRAALAVASFFVIFSYMVDVIGGVAKDTFAENMRSASFFSYYNSAGVMQNGLIWWHVLLLFAIAAVLVIASIWTFERRDIAV